MVVIGAHVDAELPLVEASKRAADLVQFFLADPQGWTPPLPRPDADELRSQRDVALYVHAPSVINLAGANNRIRLPSRTLLSRHAETAAAIGARALVVHGGHVTADVDARTGIGNWRKTVERAEFPLPVLVENTAGGDHALARRFDRVRAITGRIDLVHLNNSKDSFDSGRDRHDNLGAGQIPPDQLVAVAVAAAAPVVVETPGGAAEQAADIAFLQARL